MKRTEVENIIDAQCEEVTNGVAYWRDAALATPGMTVRDVQRRVASKYAPNPTIWGSLCRLHRSTKLALTNNGESATFRIWVERYGLASRFDFLANSEELGVRKPDPRFFTRVAAELGVQPHRCLVVDDAAESVLAAKRCGMHALQTHEIADAAVSRFAFS